MKFTALLLKTDVPDANGNVYPREVIQKALDNLESEKLIGRVGFAGQIHFSQEPSHVADNLRLESDELHADIYPLNTEPGHYLKNASKTANSSPQGQELL